MLILVGVMIAERLPWMLVVAAIGMALHPLIALVIVTLYAVWHWMRRDPRPTPAMESAFYQRLLSELESGSSVRTGLAAAIEAERDLDLAAVGRRLRAGMHLEYALEPLNHRLPHTGVLARAALLLGSETGGEIRSSIADLGAMARELTEVERQVGVHTAQARLSALLVGVLPLVAALGLMVARGGAPDPGIGRTLVAVGLGLQIVGLGFVGLILRGAA